MIHLLKHGTVSAMITNTEGEAVTTFVAPATLHDGKILIGSDHFEVLRFAMRAAGVDTVELEFCE
jgi:hypothetical protein